MINISTMKSCGPRAFEEMGTNIKLPYSGHVPGGISVGTDIVISGRPHPNCNRFSINLCVGPTCQQDCALHFNPRFDAGTIVRNHMQGGSWGAEEISINGPFRKGQNFDLVIKVTQQSYKITVNNKYFCDFQHRLPKESVQYIYINGDVTINFIQCRGGGGAVESKSYPAAPPPYPGPPLSYPAGTTPSGPFYNPSVPFTASIPGGLYSGRMIYITGIPHSRPSRFNVNLVCGPHDSQDHGLTFDVRFNFGSCRNVTVRNHKVGGTWGPEERHQNYFPCAPNTRFEMMILAEPTCFKIAFNNQHFCDFYHRIHPMERNTHVIINGDVQLTEVRFQ